VSHMYSRIPKLKHLLVGSEVYRSQIEVFPLCVRPARIVPSSIPF